MIRKVTNYRERHAQAGLCKYCPRPLAVNSKRMCLRCLKKNRENVARWTLNERNGLRVDSDKTPR